MPDRTQDEAALRELLSTPRRIAMIGASDKPGRPSHGVFAYLHRHGHDVLPVNPTVKEVEGVAAVPDLEAAKAHWGQPPEIVDVFRRPEHVPAVVDATLAVGAPWLWLQLGVVHEDAIEKAVDAGVEVVVDRCIKVEADRLVGG